MQDAAANLAFKNFPLATRSRNSLMQITVPECGVAIGDQIADWRAVAVMNLCARWPRESWLRHEVPMNMAEEERISVSFNCEWA